MQEQRRAERVVHPAKMFFMAQPIPLALFLLNLIGAIAYLAGASFAWAIPQEREAGVHSITGEPFVWFAAIFPIVAFFCVLNLVWGAIILARRQWRGGRLWVLAALVWLGATIIDFAHH
jgi:hypothetical protein